MSGTVLILSDCQMQSQAVQHIYATAGYTSFLSDVATPHISIERHKPDVVVIAPANDSRTLAPLCKQVRSVTSAPLIVTPQFHDEQEEMHLLAAGADDYVSRDRNSRVLVIRTESQLNRFTLKQRPRHHVLEIGKLTLNIDTRIAAYNETMISLTRTEFDLLAVLMNNSHRVVHREELLNRVWGSWYGDDHILEVHISRLRRKIERIGGPRILHPVRGVGYRLLSYGQTLD
ncbi:MAG: hypothetical protein RL410_739 [Actinomycetota bacterium]